jgi:hypothetical protein
MDDSNLPDFVVRRMSVALASFVKMKAVSRDIFCRFEDVLKQLEGIPKASSRHCQRGKRSL